MNLTPREQEILEWIAKGKTGPEISALLGISLGTVNRHLARAYVKLGCSNRISAIIRAGLVKVAE